MNPYELRLDVLKLSQKILEDDMALKRAALLNVSDNLPKAKLDEEIQKVSYSTDDVVAQAEKLYSFVNSNENVRTTRTSAVSTSVANNQIKRKDGGS